MQQHHHEQSAQLDRHYHEAVNPHESNKAVNVLLFICMLVLLALVSWGAYNDREALKRTAILLAYGTLILFVLIAVGYVIYLICHKLFMDKQKREHAALDVQAKKEQMQREHQRLHPDHLGNYPAIYDPKTKDVLTVPPGNYVQPVPHTIHIDGSDHSTRSAPEQNLLAAAASLHIPTFAESLASGDIGPGQRDMLFCYEILQDDVSKQVTGISPIRGEIQAQHTQLVLAGSGSGKTTYMASNMAQACVLGTLFYVIDPHKSHPEKSITAKMIDFAPWFILPPASTHQEIAHLLKHATRVRDARIAGKPTPYDGYHIMVVVDEVPALMANQKSSDKQVKQLYLELALFMQSLGIQTAKFGMTGLYASQFATKEALGEIDFRDACMSTLIMRLHPTQAQAMRTLGKENVNAIPKFPKGHGFLLLSDDPDTRRVASGNVMQYDLSRLAAQLPPSPLVSTVQKPVRNQEDRQGIMPVKVTIESQDVSSESHTKASRNQSRNQVEPALEAKVGQVRQLIAAGSTNKADNILAIWNVRPGSSEKYKQAEQEYKQIMASLVGGQAQEGV